MHYVTKVLIIIEVYLFTLLLMGHVIDQQNQQSDVTDQALSYMNPITPPSYTISTDGTTTFAKNGSTGRVDNYSTTAKTVFEYVNNSLLDGGVVFIKNGTYNGINQVKINNSIVFVGEGNNTILKSSTADGVGMFQLYGTKTSIGTLTDNAYMGNTTLYLSSVTGLSANDYILINSNRVTSYLSQTLGEIQQVKTVDSVNNAITISGLYDYYLVSDSATVYRVDYAKKIEFRNMRFEGPGAALNKIGLETRFVKDMKVDNVDFNNFGLGGIFLYSTKDTIISNSRFSSAAAPGYSYAIVSANAVDNIKIINNNFNNISSHSTTIGGTGSDGYPRNIYYIANTYQYSPGICADQHFGDNVFYYDNIFVNCRYGTEFGANNVVYDGNTFINTSNQVFIPRAESGMTQNLTILNTNILYGGFGSAGGGAVGIGNLITPINLVVRNMVIRNYNGSAIYFRNVGSLDMPSIEISDIILDNNVGCYQCEGIIITRTSTGFVNEVNINNVNMNNIGGNGILIAGVRNATITNNKLKNVDLSGTANTVYGIFMASNGTITNNVINGFRTYGIVLSGANNSLISDNLISGGTVAGQKIRLVSVYNSTITNNKIFDNVGTVGIAEITAGDWNEIYNNNLEAGSSITRLGSNTTVWQNNNIAGYYHGVIAATSTSKPYAFGAYDTFINSSHTPPNDCISTAAGTSNWVYRINGSAEC